MPFSVCREHAEGAGIMARRKAGKKAAAAALPQFQTSSPYRYCRSNRPTVGELYTALRIIWDHHGERHGVDSPESKLGAAIHSWAMIDPQNRAEYYCGLLTQGDFDAKALRRLVIDVAWAEGMGWNEVQAMELAELAACDRLLKPACDGRRIARRMISRRVVAPGDRQRHDPTESQVVAAAWEGPFLDHCKKQPKGNRRPCWSVFAAWAKTNTDLPHYKAAEFKAMYRAVQAARARVTK